MSAVGFRVRNGFAWIADRDGAAIVQSEREAMTFRSRYRAECLARHASGKWDVVEVVVDDPAELVDTGAHDARCDIAAAAGALAWMLSTDGLRSPGSPSGQQLDAMRSQVSAISRALGIETELDWAAPYAGWRRERVGSRTGGVRRSGRPDVDVAAASAGVAASTGTRCVDDRRVGRRPRPLGEPLVIGGRVMRACDQREGRLVECDDRHGAVEFDGESDLAPVPLADLVAAQ